MAIMIPLCKEYCEKRKKLVSTTGEFVCFLELRS